MNGSIRLALRALVSNAWQQLKGHSCDLAGSLPELPGTLGCLTVLSASLRIELISSSVDFAHDGNAAGLLARSDSADTLPDMLEVV